MKWNRVHKIWDELSLEISTVVPHNAISIRWSQNEVISCPSSPLPMGSSWPWTYTECILSQNMKPHKLEDHSVITHMQKAAFNQLTIPVNTSSSSLQFFHEKAYGKHLRLLITCSKMKQNKYCMTCILWVHSMWFWKW